MTILANISLKFSYWKPR